MIKFFKYSFYRIHLFYQYAFKGNANIHHNVSVTVALMLFGDIFSVINIFNLIVFRDYFFPHLFLYYIILGNLLVFSLIVISSYKQRYKKWITDSDKLTDSEKNQLNILFWVNGTISLLVVVIFITQSFLMIEKISLTGLMNRTLPTMATATS
jgi:hypothetical protein